MFSPVFGQVLPQFDSLLISVLMKSEAFGLSTNQFYDIYDDFRDELSVFPMYEKCLVAAVENSLFEYVLKLNVNGTLNTLVLPVCLMFIKKLFMHDAHFHPKILCLRRFVGKMCRVGVLYSSAVAVEEVSANCWSSQEFATLHHFL